jgi:hypothetical protein
MNKNIIGIIQENDPSYDPLALALTKSNIERDTWRAACSRVYYDGYYGPISNEDWLEQDGREPSSVEEATNIIAHVLEKVESYYELEFCEEGTTDTVCTGHSNWDTKVNADEIRAALIPFYKEIYGVGYPTMGSRNV